MPKETRLTTTTKSSRETPYKKKPSREKRIARRRPTKNTKAFKGNILRVSPGTGIFPINTRIDGNGIALIVGGHILDLSKAKCDKDGNIGVVETKSDNMVWVDGKKYYNPFTGEYFKQSDKDDAASGDNDEDADEPASTLDEKITKHMVNSIMGVDAGATVDIF